MYDRSGCSAPIAASGTNLNAPRTNADTHALYQKPNGAVEFLYATDLQ